jgi:hypothetical protein
MDIIKDWRKKKLKCYFCDETRSVKYIIEVLDPVVSDTPIKVCICNKCALRLMPL